MPRTRWTAPHIGDELVRRNGKRNEGEADWYVLEEMSGQKVSLRERYHDEKRSGVLIMVDQRWLGETYKMRWNRGEME